MNNNKAAYNSKEVIDWYKNFTGLMPVERLVFGKLSDIMKNGRVLDIGIGAGRTTAELNANCGKYIGIDYAENLIEVARHNYPHLDLRCLTASKMDVLSEAYFDLVNFSFNGLDYSGMEERQRILEEINRILRPGGYFFFSTHNRNAYNFNKSPWLDEKKSLWVNIKTFIKLLPHLPAHFENRSQELIETEFAVINNCAHNYKLMTFHSAPAYVKKQLEKNNFTEIIFFDKLGNSINEDSDVEWIFVLCRKVIS